MLSHTLRMLEQRVTHGAQLALHALASGALAQMAMHQFAQGGAGNVGVELAVHERVEVKATGEAVSGQGSEPAGE